MRMNASLPSLRWGSSPLAPFPFSGACASGPAPMPAPTLPEAEVEAAPELLRRGGSEPGRRSYRLRPRTALDTVRAGTFDNGKMWTFEYPPLDYLRETYGFSADRSGSGRPTSPPFGFPDALPPSFPPMGW